MTDIQARCPACGGHSLMLADGGYITCRRLDCPNPEAAHDAIEERAGANAYERAVTAPPSAEACAAMRKRLESGSPPRRKVRTTPDNPATTSDTADNPLREQLDEARQWARHGYEIGQRHCSWTDYGVAPAWLTEGWPHHFDSCEHLQQAGEYDEALTRVRALASAWQDAPDPLARAMAADLLSAIRGPQPAAHDDGPSVAEATADDRQWPLQREGE
jgi:hypothetical protein